MAKSDSFFGLRRGSTKTLTFSVLKGKQITKDRVEGGRNPRTPEQMVQRMCMATASAAYAQMKQIVDHSFEGITYGQTTMSEFIRVNADALRNNYYEPGEAGPDYYFSYNPYRDRLMYAGAYIMSRGTASNIIRAGWDVDTVGSGQSQTQDQVEVALYDNGAATFSADSVMAGLGIGVGDMATVCFLFERDSDAAAVFGFVRVTALQSGTVALTSANLSTYFKLESNLDIVSTTVGETSIKINVKAEGFADGTSIAKCCIHSMKQNGKWLRSNAAFDVGSYPVRPTAADALETYPVGPAYVLNGGAIED